MTGARRGAAFRTLLALVVAAGLAFDAYVHFHLASTYDVVRTSTLSQGDLFRAEGVLAITAAAAVLMRPRRYTAVFAALVAASALTAVLVYRYAQVGAIGPIPAMYEPAWYPDKTRATWAEAVATLAAVALVVVVHGGRRRSERTPRRSRDASSGSDAEVGATAPGPA